MDNLFLSHTGDHADFTFLDGPHHVYIEETQTEYTEKQKSLHYIFLVYHHEDEKVKTFIVREHSRFMLSFVTYLVNHASKEIDEIVGNSVRMFRTGERQYTDYYFRDIEKRNVEVLFPKDKELNELLEEKQKELQAARIRLEDFLEHRGN